MSSQVSLASTLASLKYITSSSLSKNSSNSAHLTKCVKEFKRNFIKSLDSNQYSDFFLVNLSECLYDLKASDVITCHKLSRNFESRPYIIANQLKGGVLWAYYNSSSYNRRKKKVISSSCRVAIKQAIQEFLDLKNNVTNISKFDCLLRNLKVVGDCYRVPISPKTRLEQSILESSEVFKLSLECFQLLLPMCNAFCSLSIDNEKIGKLMVELFCDQLQKNDLLTLNEITSIIKILYKWKISLGDKTIMCIDFFKEILETGGFDFTRNVSSTIKLFTAVMRLPSNFISYYLCCKILNETGLLVSLCNNSDLVLFFSSISQFKKIYPESDLTGLNPLISNLETYLEYENIEFIKKDLNTIHRSCMILKDYVELNKLMEMTIELMNTNNVELI